MRFRMKREKLNKMKSIYLLTLLSLALFACKGKEKIINFKMDYNAEVVVPSSTGINLPFNILTPEIETNSEAICEVKDTRKDLIKNILVKELSLTISTPNGEDFSFLKSISIFLNADGEEELELAWNYAVSDAASSPLALEVSTTNIDNYIKKDKFSLRCNTITDELIASDYYINVYSRFSVEAALFQK